MPSGEPSLLISPGRMSSSRARSRQMRHTSGKEEREERMRIPEQEDSVHAEN